MTEEKEEKLRSKLEKCEEAFKSFRKRMSQEASTEIACSGSIFEDITNPCRPSEVQKAYEKLEMTLWPEGEEKSKENERKDQIERMIKEVFPKAAKDMEKKKKDLESFFNMNDDTKIPDNKKMHCINTAVQGLQKFILWQECELFQNMDKKLGRTPDIISEMADKCYKQGCLMALCNPPLILDWENKDSGHFLPPILQQNNESGSGGNVSGGAGLTTSSGCRAGGLAAHGKDGEVDDVSTPASTEVVSEQSMDTDERGQ